MRIGEAALAFGVGAAVTFLVIRATPSCAPEPLVHAEDPGLRAIVADTAYFPGHEGDRLTGVYLIRGSELVRVH